MPQPETCPATTVAPAGIGPDEMPVLWRCIREPGHRDADGVIHHVGRRFPADEHLIYWSPTERGASENAGFAGSSVRKASPGGVVKASSDSFAAAAAIVDRWQDAALMVQGSYVSVPKAELDTLVEHLRSVYRDVGEDGVDHLGTAFSTLELLRDRTFVEQGIDVPVFKLNLTAALDHLRFVRNRQLTFGTLSRDAISARDIEWLRSLDSSLRSLELNLQAIPDREGSVLTDPRLHRVRKQLAEIRAKVKGARP